ncbi:FMN-dependent oxidoreductase (nitrilotriacetate monooxygenase family) [Kineococcus rhizosphaerae]|uniref:FMN-dependent oxidoreductase (Nitrilotriacetate monooxygenase family) n=2 Tax=Kineococcus rhizosphaerae TaxID=559628 RepID=A0A2T0QYC1_9ACTN|nr:FMN-dependent oxidoreductase (nitrilotriacetate monooxygenase family) [Kineococcus rhizosphaerae]
MHLGWFMNFTRPAWTTPWVSADEARGWTDGDYHVDWIRAMERAKFDFMMLEDSSMVSDGYRGTMDADLKHSLYAPKHDPLVLAPVLARETRHIGIVSTASTSFYPPFLLARSLATIDHLSGGRAGWNIVTSSEDRAAQNFGLDALYEHDSRYDRADEFVEVVEALWNSWGDEALVADRATGTYVDARHVRPIRHEGRFYKVRGPLNTLPSPQRRPVYLQAGGSPRGREFAARHADAIICAAQGVRDMREFRDDIRSRAKGVGRDPDSIKVMYIALPIVAASQSEADRVYEEMRNPSEAAVEVSLGHMGALTEIDFSGVDPDAPLGELETNGHRTTLEKFLALGSTLREATGAWATRYTNPAFVGTPDKVAAAMTEEFDEVGGDGYLITGGGSRKAIAELTDGLVGALADLGRVRRRYEHELFRDNLLDF